MRGPNHLRELREIIYPSLKPERSADTPLADGFCHLSSESLSYPLHLDVKRTDCRFTGDDTAPLSRQRRGQGQGSRADFTFTDHRRTTDAL
jgi:hypothetical protein